MAFNDTTNQGAYYILDAQYVDNRVYPFSPTEAIISSTSDMIFPESFINGLNLEIIIQPVDKFRFRYKSEAGSHGGITGEGHSRLNKAYPTVKLHNLNNLYSDRKIFIKVSLYTSDNNPRPHVLELVGKICTDGVAYQKLDSRTSSAKFQGISISNKTKHEVIEILKTRKKQELNVSSLNKDQDEEIQDELKNLNLNAVKLCFEAVFEDNLDPVPGCEKIFSNTIFNLKSTFTGDLKICRLSNWRGKCTGGEDIIILCNKIKKDEIQIKFFEKDEQENILWSTEAKFNPLEVHYQVAIPFKTPKYEGPHLDKLEDGDEVVAWIQLLRKKDKKEGEPVQFTYWCDKTENSKKRKLGSSIESGQSLLSNSNWDHLKLDGITPEDFKNIFNDDSCYFDNVFDVNDDMGLGFPSVVKTDAVDANADPLFLPQSFVPNGSMSMRPDSSVFDKDTGLQMSHTSSNSSFEDNFNYITSVFAAVGVTTETLNDNKWCVSEAINEDSVIRFNCSNASSEVVEALESAFGSLSLSGRGNSMKMGCGADIKQSKIERFSLGVKNLLKDKDISYYSSESVTIQDSNGNSLLHLAIMEKTPEVLFGILAFIKENLVNHKNLKKETPLHLAVCGNYVKVLKLLLKHGGNPFLTNKDGNNCFHLASIYNFTECMKELLHSLSSDGEKEQSPNINSLNFDGLAPIHLCITNNSKECMKLLLNAKADVNVIENKSGKSPFHLAVELRSPLAIDLLSQPDIDIDREDYRGFTALENACEAHGVSYESLTPEKKFDKQQIALILTEFFKKEDLNESISQEGTESETSSEDEDFQEKVENYLNNNNIWKKLGPLVDTDEESLEMLGKMDKNPAKTLIEKIKESKLDTEDFSGSSKDVLLRILKMVGLDDAIIYKNAKHL